MTMFDTPTHYPQFAPQGQFGNLPGQYGQPSAGGLGQQQFGGAMGQPGRFLPFEGGLAPLVPMNFAPQGAFGNPFGQYGQPGIHTVGAWPGHQQFGGFAPQGLFGTLPGYGQPQAFGVWPGHQQLGGFAPQGLFGGLPGYGQPLAQAIGGWPGHQQLGGLAPQFLFAILPQYAQPTYPGGGWPGHAQFGGLAPQFLLGALPGQYGQPIGAIGGWPGQQQLGNQLTGGVGRSFLPYQAAPPMAYAG